MRGVDVGDRPGQKTERDVPSSDPTLSGHLLPQAGEGKGPAAVHATAIAIAGRALLIIGPSRSGKSRLACALIAASTRRRPIRLIGDDRILLMPSALGVLARPHPRIAGFIERRGLGLVAVPYLAAAPLAAIVTLGGSTTFGGSTTSSPIALQNFPVLPLVKADETARRDVVLVWWGDVSSATSASHPTEKGPTLPG